MSSGRFWCLSGCCADLQNYAQEGAEKSITDLPEQRAYAGPVNTNRGYPIMPAAHSHRLPHANFDVRVPRWLRMNGKKRTAIGAAMKQLQTSSSNEGATCRPNCASLVSASRPI